MILASLSTALITGAPPPQLLVPSFGQATLGWLMGAAVFLGPLVLSGLSWRRRRRHWWALLTQWNTTPFWILLLGAVIAALGMFTLIGIIPSWQSSWNDWFVNVVAQNTTADRTTLAWNEILQQQYAFALQVSAGVTFLLGAAGVYVGQQRLARKLAEFHEGPDDWLIAPPEANAPTTPSSRVLNHPFSTQN